MDLRENAPIPPKLTEPEESETGPATDNLRLEGITASIFARLCCVQAFRATAESKRTWEDSSLHMKCASCQRHKRQRLIHKATGPVEAIKGTYNTWLPAPFRLGRRPKKHTKISCFEGWNPRLRTPQRFSGWACSTGHSDHCTGRTRRSSRLGSPKGPEVSTKRWISSYYPLKNSYVPSQGAFETEFSFLKVGDHNTLEGKWSLGFHFFKFLLPNKKHMSWGITSQGTIEPPGTCEFIQFICYFVANKNPNQTEVLSRPKQLVIKRF